jgi:hypothetical protein
MLPCHDARIPSGTQRSSTAVEYQAIWVMSSIWVESNENLCGKKAFISPDALPLVRGAIPLFSP